MLPDLDFVSFVSTTRRARHQLIVAFGSGGDDRLWAREAKHACFSLPSLLDYGDSIPACGVYLAPTMLMRPSFTFISPALPIPAERPPIGGEWVHEIKHDGFRMMVRRDASGVRVLTRNGHDWSERFPVMVQAAAGLKAGSCLIDGEAVCCDEHGLAVFAMLRYRRRPTEIFLYAFDLLELDGEDLRRESLETRKATLASLLRVCGPGLRLVEHLDHGGDVVFRHACKLGCEGIVSKRLGSPYVSGRTRHWLKFKNPAAPAVKREAEEEWSKRGQSV